MTTAKSKTRYGAQHTATPGALQAAANQEGQQSRVITALSYDTGQLIYLSYSWQSDTSTVYETGVVTADFTTLGSVATNLAAQGYIITAMGGIAADGILLVGTRVKGDSLPRPIMIIPVGQSPDILAQEGYASIGAAFSSIGQPIWWIGEQ